MNIVATIGLTFALLAFGALMAAFWSVWFPTTRCQKLRRNAEDEYNVCIRVRKHEGPHMTANGLRFK